MKEVCIGCCDIVSTTGEPSEVLGYFLSNAVIDQLDGQPVTYRTIKTAGKRIVLCKNCQENRVRTAQQRRA